MARSLIRRRQEAERQRIAAYEATLRRARFSPRQPPDIAAALTDAAASFRHEAIREPGDWAPKLKTRDPGRLRLAAARHLFARYPVAAPLECIWLSDLGLGEEEIQLRRSWYVVAAKGGSLFRQGAGAFLSRSEVHCFLNPPGDLGFDEAIWQAIARSYTDDAGLALRIARSRIARTDRRQMPFWRQVARFFCANPLPTEEIDDLTDYIAARCNADAEYSMKGRTLSSLRRQMRQWHRDLAAIARIEQAQRIAAMRYGYHHAENIGRWPGSSLSDWTWRPNAKEARTNQEAYEVVQLKTAADLVAESSAMHHCVSAYAQKCIHGYASIWSLRAKRPGKTERMLTIELDPHGNAVQVRGFGNRLATTRENSILKRWAKAMAVTLPSYRQG